MIALGAALAAWIGAWLSLAMSPRPAPSPRRCFAERSRMSRKALPILSGAVLLGSLFLPCTARRGAAVSTISAWTVFWVTDVALAVLAVVIAAVPPVRVAAAWIAVVPSPVAWCIRPSRVLSSPTAGSSASPARSPPPGRAGCALGNTAGVGGLVLVLALGLEWYEFALTDAVGPNEPDPCDPVSGWIQDSSGSTVFTRLDVALTALPRSSWRCR